MLCDDLAGVEIKEWSLFFQSDHLKLNDPNYPPHHRQIRTKLLQKIFNLDSTNCEISGKNKNFHGLP